VKGYPQTETLVTVSARDKTGKAVEGIELHINREMAAQSSHLSIWESSLFSNTTTQQAATYKPPVGFLSQGWRISSRTRAQISKKFFRVTMEILKSKIRSWSMT
jgi:plasmid replication initiation protein